MLSLLRRKEHLIPTIQAYFLATQLYFSQQKTRSAAANRVFIHPHFIDNEVLNISPNKSRSVISLQLHALQT